MESRPQNPEFRNNPENFHSNMDYRLYNIKVSVMISGNIYLRNKFNFWNVMES